MITSDGWMGQLSVRMFLFFGDDHVSFGMGKRVAQGSFFSMIPHVGSSLAVLLLCIKCLFVL